MHMCAREIGAGLGAAQKALLAYQYESLRRNGKRAAQTVPTRQRAGTVGR